MCPLVQVWMGAMVTQAVVVAGVTCSSLGLQAFKGVAEKIEVMRCT